MEIHILGNDGRFACSRADMRVTEGAGRHKRQEREANQFAIGLLAPPFMMRSVLDIDPDLSAIAKLAGRLDISMEAALRRVIELHDEPIAAVWTRNGACKTSARSTDFPWIDLAPGQTLPAQSEAARFIVSGEAGITDWVQTDASHWTGAHGVEMFGQTRSGCNGHAVTLLWATLPDTDDVEETRELGTPSFSPRRRRR